jgi:hypothetical protein
MKEFREFNKIRRLSGRIPFFFKNKKKKHPILFFFTKKQRFRSPNGQQGLTAEQLRQHNAGTLIIKQVDYA